jgi:3-oxoacyl-[acyl-carrier protein] reductase
MSERLHGHVAIVTGGAQGIGEATAVRLARDGAAVAVADINEEGARRVADAIEDTGGRSLAIKLDVTEREQWERAIAEITEGFGKLDIVVNNAGIVQDHALLEMSDEAWQAVIDINLRGTFLGSQHGLRQMRDLGWGRIINVSSTSWLGWPGQANYSAAKGGIIALTRTTALEAASHGVLVNAVVPNSVETPLTANYRPRGEADEAYGQYPLKRAAQPSELASVVAFLASDDASYITGQAINVCGGATLSI